MDVSIITQNDVLRESCEAIQLQHTESNGTLYAQLPGSVRLEAGDCIGFLCVDGRYRLFEISSREIREPDGILDIHAVDKAICELMDEPVTDVRARDTTIGTYLSRLLASTRFTIGQVSVNPSGTTTGYYESVWSAMAKAMEVYDVRLVPYFVLTGGRITGRRVDILSTVAKDRGRIFELGDDLAGLSVSYDDSQIKTALYGRGQGVQIDGGDDSSDPAYGRRLTFADVVWTTAGGDPADKPAGQEWIGDPDALANYGRDGRHRYGFVTFDDETDAEKLLAKTWDYLQKIKDPIISITGTVQDTARMFGHDHEGVAIYDSVLVRMVRFVDGSKIKTDIRAQVVDVVRDYVQPEQTKMTIGNAAVTAGTLVRQLSDTIDSYRSRAAIWDRANAFDLDGVMDVMNNQIVSTTGHWYTDPDTGAIMLVSSDETLAMRLTGAGWQISSGKVGGQWVWRTAATGSGIVADQITAGVLQAQLVKILGTDKFYWDKNAISIINPNDARKIIKIGQYNGVDYGIGFSADGGQTWTQSMNFDGIIATSIGTLKISTEQITGSITSGTGAAQWGIDFTNGTMKIGTLAVGKITGALEKSEVTGQTAWKIDFTNGTLTIGAISADSIKAGTLSADRIGGHSIGTGKLTGSITNGTGAAQWGIDFTTGTMKIGTLAVGSITGALEKTEVTGQTAWKIDFTNGTLTIGAISADSIKAGTLSADRIGGHSIGTGKLSGSISNGGWGIDFTNGTMSIGTLSVGKITGSVTSGTGWGIDFTNGTMSIGTLAVGKITGALEKTEVTGQKAWKIDFTNGTLTIGAISADSIKAGTLSADRIGAGAISLGKLKTGSVFTSISDSGIKLTHAQAIGGWTWLDSNGLRFFNGAGTQTGGMITMPDGTVGVATQILYNPQVSTLNVQVGANIHENEDGLRFKMGTVHCFDLTGAEDTFRLSTGESDPAFVYGSSGGLILDGPGGAEYHGPYGSLIQFDTTGNIYVSWMHNGILLRYSMYDILTGNVD